MPGRTFHPAAGRSAGDSFTSIALTPEDVHAADGVHHCGITRTQATRTRLTRHHNGSARSLIDSARIHPPHYPGGLDDEPIELLLADHRVSQDTLAEDDTLFATHLPSGQAAASDAAARVVDPSRSA
ncbi:hypothetical protein [Amycolatopsis sp. NPDC059021]|uniref:hypothetical protein n=1 Tax=Amycolatopsis sp. NPDC059021 TaxID=3346704 RepID=UPI003670BA46